MCNDQERERGERESVCVESYFSGSAGRFLFRQLANQGASTVVQYTLQFCCITHLLFVLCNVAEMFSVCTVLHGVFVSC